MVGYPMNACPLGALAADQPLVMSQHRNTVQVPIRLSDHDVLRQCIGTTGSKNTPYRVMVFCAGDPHGLQDVAFPHQSELRVNKVDIKANLRGLKNKPGSTRPVDITKELHLRSSYTNSVDFTYALTQKVSPRLVFSPHHGTDFCLAEVLSGHLCVQDGLR